MAQLRVTVAKTPYMGTEINLLTQTSLNVIFGKWWFSIPFCAENKSWKLSKMKFPKKSQFSDGEVIFRQTLLVLDQFGHVLPIPELRNAFACILRRVLDFKVKNAIFSCWKCHFEGKFCFIAAKLQNYASLGQENVFWCQETLKTHPNYPQTKGFVFKHRQNDSKTLFAKIKFLHFFQNFIFENLEIQSMVPDPHDFWIFWKFCFRRRSLKGWFSMNF